MNPKPLPKIIQCVPIFPLHFFFFFTFPLVPFTHLEFVWSKTQFHGKIPFGFGRFSGGPKARQQNPNYENPTTGNTPRKAAVFANKPNFMQQISIAPMEVQM